MPLQPFFHEESGAVRFWVWIETRWFGASIARQVLHYRFRPHASGEDPMETYVTHAQEIAAAVRRRVGQGALEPVMLREADMPAQA